MYILAPPWRGENNNRYFSLTYFWISELYFYQFHSTYELQLKLCLRWPEASFFRSCPVLTLDYYPRFLSKIWDNSLELSGKKSKQGRSTSIGAKLWYSGPRGGRSWVELRCDELSWVELGRFWVRKGRAWRNVMLYRRWGGVMER